jgi:selenocysteine lyase/cysteine desulfurase
MFYAKKSAQHHLKAMMVCAGYEDTSIRRLENYNTRNLPEVLGMGTALDYLNLIGGANKAQRIYDLKHYFLQQIQEDAGFRLKTPAADHLSAGIQTVEVVGMDVNAAQKALFDKARIDCRPMTTHGLNGLRISLSIFNTKADVDYLVDAMRALQV